MSASEGSTEGTVERPSWFHLVDPTEAQLREVVPADLHASALARMAASPDPDREARPKLDSRGDHVVGVLVVAVDIPHDDDEPAGDGVYFQEIHVVVEATRIVTVCKTPPTACHSTWPRCSGSVSEPARSPGRRCSTSSTRWPRSTSTSSTP